MGVYDRIQSALETRLAAWSGISSLDGGVVWENVRSGPRGPESRFARAYFMPAAAARGSMGPGGYSRVDGAFIIILHTPLGAGTGEIGALVDSLAAWFKSGTILSSSGTYVTVVSSERGSGGVADAWWGVPVTIQWYTITDEV